MAAAAQQQNASLYVGDLPSDVTEAVLFELFKAVGPVLSIRVCRDAVTRRSLGYAYVNFQNPQDAERALETLNYHAIKNQPIRIMWSHRDPNLRKGGAGNIFIKNLHASIDNQTLYDTFSQFGNILSCKVALDNLGNSRGYGFVHFESLESAKAAIEKVDGMLLKSLQVYVARHVRRAQRDQHSEQNFTNLFVKDLKNGVTKDELEAYFSKFGTVHSACLMHHKTEKDERPFAFIDFGKRSVDGSVVSAPEVQQQEHDAAVKAVAECHDVYVPELCDEDTKLYVARAQKKIERVNQLKRKTTQEKARRFNEYNASNLFVKNLDDDVDDKELKEAFVRFGDIISAKVMMDDRTPPQSKGFGFVCFKDVEAANKAINEMNGHIQWSKPLYVNLAQKKEVRRAALEIQYSSHLTSSRPGTAAQPMMPQGQPMGYPPMGYPPAPYGMGYGGPTPGYGAYTQIAGRAPPMGSQKWPQQMPFAGMQPSMMRGAPQQMNQPRRMPQQPQQQQRMLMPQQPQAGRGMAGRGMGQPQQAVALSRQARNSPATGALSVGASGAELTAPALASMTPEQQKNTLGEQLFARISQTHAEQAAKITGMLLEMDVTEILNLLESPNVISAKIQEAMEVLKQHEATAM